MTQRHRASAMHLIEDTKAILAQNKTDYLDLIYCCHRPDTFAPVEEIVRPGS